MTKDEFEDVVQRLKQGDNSALSFLHLYQQRCIRALMHRSDGRCSSDQGYDIFIDSVMDFRSNVLQDKVVYQNIPAYLHRICWNKWLEQSRKKTREAGAVQLANSLLTSDVQDPEAVQEAEDMQTRQRALVEQAMQQISGQCRTILWMAIADKISMAEIATQLKMASADVAKTTKSRCYKKLIEIIRKLSQP